MSQEANHETWIHHSVRKKLKAINMLAVTTGAHIVVWKPAPGRQFVLEAAYLKVRTSEGTFSDAPNILLDNGTDGDTHVADVATSTTEGAIQALTIATVRLIDYDHPLRLKITDAPAGGTAIKMDIIIFARKISE